MHVAVTDGDGKTQQSEKPDCVAYGLCQGVLLVPREQDADARGQSARKVSGLQTFKVQRG